MSAWAVWLSLHLGWAPVPVESRPTVILVVGAAGADEYGREFAAWADRWRAAAQRGGARIVEVGRAPASAAAPDRRALQQTLAESVRPSAEPLWLVFIGHGTFDGRTAKFNLRGPDVSAEELAAWLEPIERPTAVINCSSCSGPFISPLARPGRVLVTATKSGFEHNFARFGKYLSEAIADAAADLDGDGQTSLLEAFLTASRAAEDFYRRQGRLATEHALLEDTGDGRAVPAGWYRGIRPVLMPADGTQLDGLRAHQFHLIGSDADRRLTAMQRRRRDELELALVELRGRKGTLEPPAYQDELESLLLELAELYERAEAASP